MAFEKQSAQQKRSSADALKRKKKSIPDFEEERAAVRKSAVTEPDEEGMQGKNEKKEGSRGGIVVVLLSILLIAGGVALMYADMNRPYRHGIYRCEDGRMMEEPAAPDPEKTAAVTAKVKKLAEAHPDVQQYMMIVPNAAAIQSKYLPKDAKVRDQKADLAEIGSKMPQCLHWIDLTDLLAGHAGEKLYYASDIYLTGWGSRYAAREALSEMDADLPKGRDQCYLLSDSFRGRLAGDRIPVREFFEKEGERIEIYVPEAEAYYYRVDGLSGNWSGSLYDSAAAESAQPFNVFFGGEKALTEIYTTAVNGETLLVVGDRTADTIVPLFVSSFENIVLMHPSICTKTVEDLISKYKPTKILYLYGANKYMTDSALLRALQ